MQTFKDLDAWKIGLELAKEVYLLTATFPKEERYGLTSQLRRAVVSILANIAEGFGRFTYPDKANKYTISRGECAEVEALLVIAQAVGFVQQENIRKAQELRERQSKILSGLINSCRSRI